ncbi:MAG: hypothetical protein ACRYFV_20630 [Janthinobacterium lividum]
MSNTPPTAYEQRVVAFIDILGFTAYIKDKSNDEAGFASVYAALSEVQDYFTKPNEFETEDSRNFFRNDTQIITASDCVIISRRIDERGGIYQMLWDCDFVTHLLIERGFLCRGGIAFGDLYHKGNLIFGPAYLEALYMEKAADVPIVVFNQKLFDIAAANPLPGQEEYGAAHAQDLMGYCKTHPKQQDTYYLDYFTNYDSWYGGGEGSASIHYEYLRKLLAEGITESEPQNTDTEKQALDRKKVFEKYRWAAEQYNLTAQNFELKLVDIHQSL